MIRYVSDLHLYDNDVIHSRFPNWSEEYYANFIRHNWELSVNEDDCVIIVGDVGIPVEQTFNVIRSLSGNKVLVVGNHDVCWGPKLYDSSMFVGTHEYISMEGIYIQHIPDFDANVANTHQYLIHGHHHDYFAYGMQTQLLLYLADTNRLNCAVDQNNYTPCTLQELIINKELLSAKCNL